ncbi:MAG: serine/threonine protein kinase [Candidatus Obscuribacterales bacterium]|jgi:tRNA A-37 threonylcarbamoyl transferase component Bud32|nr:serine/threonine protein kinase [Candidatus Obscuribacterales bacterium]
MSTEIDIIAETIEETTASDSRFRKGNASRCSDHLVVADSDLEKDFAEQSLIMHREFEIPVDPTHAETTTLNQDQLTGGFIDCRKREIWIVVAIVLIALVSAQAVFTAVQPILHGAFNLADRFILLVLEIVKVQLGLLLLLYPVAIIIGLRTLLKWFNEFSQTNRIDIADDGIVLGWQSTPQELIPWGDLTSIFLFRPESTMLPRKWLVGFGCSATRPINVKIDVVTPIGRELLAVLKKKAPWISIDPDLIEIFEPAIADSRTELWMKSISQAPQEEQLLPLTPGDRLNNDRYEIIGRIGVGGQGTAYLAKDLTNDSDVVIKESLFPVYVDTNVREEYSHRFEREVELLQRFDHPSVVRLLDSFQSPHRGYLVLDLIDGDSLRKKVQKESRMDEETVRNLLKQMTEIMSYLHGLSPPVVHRDFTPDNLILDKTGRLVLIDFNVAREMLSTKTATVVGKHAYIPAEQFRGQFDERSDIYALGCTLHFLLTGNDPEPITQSQPKLEVQEISEELDALVQKCTEQDVVDRFQNIKALVDHLGKASDLPM